MLMSVHEALALFWAPDGQQGTRSAQFFVLSLEQTSWGWDAYKAPHTNSAKTQGSPLNGSSGGPVPMCMRGSSIQVSQAPSTPERQV